MSGQEYQTKSHGLNIQDNNSSVAKFLRFKAGSRQKEKTTFGVLGDLNLL